MISTRQAMKFRFMVVAVFVVGWMFLPALVETAQAASVTVLWTAPGDDGNSGTATSYDIRYSTSSITSANWGQATTVPGEPAPSVAGSNESMTIAGLQGSTLYFFAIKTSDESGNESGLSNVLSVTTGDDVAPAAIVDLSASQ